MPNWCSNKLRVTGKRKEIDKFMKRVRGKGLDHWIGERHDPKKPKETLYLDLGKFVRPDKETLIKNKGNSEAWYWWNVNNLGTKWFPDIDKNDREITHFSNGMSSVVYTFDSAWGPPDRAVKPMSEKFPTLEIYLDYVEPGMAFAGSCHGYQGESYDSPIDFTKENFPEYFEDEDLYENETTAV